MKLKLIISSLLSLTLVGCAISKEVYLADGSKGYSISCDGNMQNFGSCLEKAGELGEANGKQMVSGFGYLIMGIAW
jgi:hypothetical protein